MASKRREIAAVGAAGKAKLCTYLMERQLIQHSIQIKDMT
jgi:hypothetical protein